MFNYFTVDYEGSVILFCLLIAFLLLMLLVRIQNRQRQVRITAFNHGYRDGDEVEIKGLRVTVRNASRDNFYIIKGGKQ